ncbi:nucleoside triphosphate hydrolase protein [Wolfiporia cocos MD-104 SS10]|uniref:Nucleoside triphosphate hydrolase protein n=1 Tax=Wolfiporia cocos (strain MD-104) TaxID=742152 RepID=A0A2H3JRL5_WOLCO|nr:nucleoside triphosphate hydrolase protein [Wolfiporia cocos MD-104 SS10]
MSAPGECSETEQLVVLILVGLIGSGKSTFAQALEAHLPHFRRCNQDDLGNRRAVEALARRSLHEGRSVCIDRSNFDAQQRATWIGIAREFPGTQVWVVVLDTPYEVCAQRLRERTDHPTIKTPEQGLSVLARFQSQFQLPSAHEGYERILYLRPDDHPSSEYARDDILEILQRVRDAPLPTPGPLITSHFPPASRGSRGRGSGRYRGRAFGGYRGRGFPGTRGSPSHGRGRGWSQSHSEREVESWRSGSSS